MTCRVRSQFFHYFESNCPIAPLRPSSSVASLSATSNGARSSPSRPRSAAWPARRNPNRSGEGWGEGLTASPSAPPQRASAIHPFRHRYYNLASLDRRYAACDDVLRRDDRAILCAAWHAARHRVHKHRLAPILPPSPSPRASRSSSFHFSAQTKGAPLARPSEASTSPTERPAPRARGAGGEGRGVVPRLNT